MLFITPVHLLLLTNRGTEGIPVSRFDFYPLVFFRGAVCLTKDNNFHVELISSFLHWLFPPAAPSLAGHAGSRADRWGGAGTRCRLFLSANQVFSIRESSCRWEDTYPLFIERNVSARCTLGRPSWVELNPLGEAGGALTISPATLEPWACPAESLLSAQPTRFIPPLLDIWFY